MSEHNATSEGGRKLEGLLAEFDSVDPLMGAAEQVRDAGYQKWDAHTPFPVHGLDGAMGIKPTILPWLVLGAGLTGLAAGIGLQWWTNAVDYAYLISGKPLFSLPANIPVGFEVIVLLSALTTFFGVLMLNGLPDFFSPLHGVKRFARATNDRFFIFIDARDPRFDQNRTESLLKTGGATAVEPVWASKGSTSLPRGLVYGGIALVALTLLPLAFFAKARVSKSRDPRVHIVWDMDSQPKFKAQSQAGFFADGRASRLHPEGTVAHGSVDVTDPAVSGKTAGGAWLRQFPAAMQMDLATVKRGQERYNIYCTPCHGYGGRGDGLVSQRAEALGESKWVPPSDLHTAMVRDQPVGQLYNTVTNGIRNMSGYAAQIPQDDRWAIVAYMRALQLSQNAPLSTVPSRVVPTLK